MAFEYLVLAERHVAEVDIRLEQLRALVEERSRASRNKKEPQRDASQVQSTYLERLDQLYREVGRVRRELDQMRQKIAILG